MTTTTKKEATGNTTNMLRKVVVIVGPTASGKTALSIVLAQKFGGEVISADSRQVYRKLNIGTGKVTKREMKGVRHHLLDVADARTTYSADAFLHAAQRAITSIAERGHVPIIAGGTGFYIDALTGRITLGDVEANLKLRKKLSTERTEALCTRLEKADPHRYADIVRKNEINNRVRLIRAIEIALAPKKQPSTEKSPAYDVLYIGVTHPREVLRERINKRLKERIQQGMFREMKNLHAQGLSWKRMDELGLEYRYGSAYIRGALSREDVERILQQKIWQYARRQLTYWKRNTEIHWYNPKDVSAIQKRVTQFLAH